MQIIITIMYETSIVGTVNPATAFLPNIADVSQLSNDTGVSRKSLDPPIGMLCHLKPYILKLLLAAILQINFTIINYNLKC